MTDNVDPWKKIQILEKDDKPIGQQSKSTSHSVKNQELLLLRIFDKILKARKPLKKAFKQDRNPLKTALKGQEAL